MDDSQVVALGGRVPYGVRRRLKSFCVANELELQQVLAEAVMRYLDVAEGRESGATVPGAHSYSDGCCSGEGRARTGGWTCPLDGERLQSMAVTVGTGGEERTRFVHFDGTAHGDEGPTVRVELLGSGGFVEHAVRDVEHREDGTTVLTVRPVAAD